MSLSEEKYLKKYPPKVEYSLTELGQSFVPVLHTMCEWGNTYATVQNLEREEQICRQHE
ncbi:HxlR family transcriptional regulator [Actinobacillus pleuropneumoniae]|nr:HxlR family transcriptional regulator [Actinobacillus pleuropneumoniae]